MCSMIALLSRIAPGRSGSSGRSSSSPVEMHGRARPWPHGDARDAERGEQTPRRRVTARVPARVRLRRPGEIFARSPHVNARRRGRAKADALARFLPGALAVLERHDRVRRRSGASLPS
jgi:hypothetical protein